MSAFSQLLKRSTLLRKALIYILFAAIFVLMLFAGFEIAGYAQDGATGVDVLFLVDQSGSMGGSPQHPVPNDSLGLRFEAPIDFVEVLGEDRLQIRPDTIYRVALIDFGDYAVPRLGWTDIMPTSWEELNSQLADLTSDGGGLNPGEYKDSNLGNTNFMAAFQKADEFFNQLDDAGSDRERVIILLTDGQPCIPPPPPNEEGIPCLNPYQHMADLQAFAASNFPSPQYKIFVVAMNDSESDYWKQMESRWQKIAGGWARKVSSNHEVGIYFHDIMKAITKNIPKPPNGPESTVKEIKPGPTVVPPYLDTISFTLFKQSPDDVLEVRDSSDRLLSSDMPDVEESGKNIYKMTVFRPEPGLWRVSTNANPEDVDIEMRTVVARGHLLSPSGTLVQYVPTTISWQLLDSAGQPLPDYADPRYRLAPKVTIQGADGSSTPVELHYKGDSTYEAEYTPLSSGIHTVMMDAVSQDLNGNEIVVIQGPVGDFVVSPVSLAPVELPYQHSQFTPLTLTYELVDQGGNPVGVGAGVMVSATIQAGDNSWDLVFQNQPDGRLVTDFTPVQTGTHTIDIIANTVMPGGEVKTLASGPGGSFNVVSPVFDLKSPIGSQPQHLPMAVRYQVQDGLGKEWKLAPAYQLDFTVVPELDGSPLPIFSLSQVDAQIYEGEFTPDEQGNYFIKSKATVRTPDGTTYPVLDHSFQVAVVPTKMLNLLILHPENGEKQSIRKLSFNPKGFFSKPQPMVIEVQLEDETGTPQDPKNVFSGAPAIPFVINVVNTDTKEDISDQFVFAPTGVVGLFRAESENAPRGQYDVTVFIPSDVKTNASFVLLDSQRQVQVTMQRTENPYWILMLVVIAVAIVGGVLSFVIYKNRIKKLSAHPASGTLSIENEQGAPIATLTLGGRNYLKYKKFSPLTHIKQLEVRCKNDADSKARRVDFTALLDDGSTTSGMLTPGPARRKLGKYQVFIRKIN